MGGVRGLGSVIIFAVSVCAFWVYSCCQFGAALLTLISPGSLGWNLWIFISELTPQPHSPTGVRGIHRPISHVAVVLGEGLFEL